MSHHHHWQALWLALASSTDNFAVGVSMGLRAARLEGLWEIAFCNAAGSFLASAGGRQIQFLHPLAAMAFLYLAWEEFGSAPNQLKLRQQWWEIALPMTLNNLAGGVTAGVMGIPPTVNFVYAGLGATIRRDSCQKS